MKPSPGNDVLSPEVPLRLGNWIPAPNDPLAQWRSDGVGLFSFSPGGPPSGLLAQTNTAYVGVRFQTAQGLRSGWVKVGANPDTGWQPQADTPIRVVDQPGPPPVTESESLVAIHLGPSHITDFVVVVRAWTNLVSGEVGASATLKNWVSGTNSSEYEIVGEPGTAGGEPVWLGYPLREGALFPTQLPTPAQWVLASEGVVLNDSRSLPGVTEPVGVGPLARKATVTIGLRRPGASSRPGWMRLNREYQLEAACPEMADVIQQVVGEANPIEQSDHQGSVRDFTRQRLDLDGDGIVECLVRTHYQSDASAQNSTEEDELVPLGETAILTGSPFLLGEPIPMESAGGRTWQRAPLLTYRFALGFIGPVEQYRVATPIGLQFVAAGGVRLAWLQLWRGSDRYYGWFYPGGSAMAYEPRSGVPLNAGEVPNSLWASAQGDLLSVQWNPALNDWNLETASVLPTSEWTATTSATPGRAILPLDGAARFCRLAPKRVNEGLQRVFTGCPGAVTALALTPDGAGLVVSGFEGARLWRSSDGHFVRSYDENEPTEWVRATAVSPGGRFLLTHRDAVKAWSPTRRWLRLWDTAESRLVAEQEAGISDPLSGLSLDWLAVSPEGRWLLLDGVLWDVQAKEVRRFEGVAGSFSPDGVWLLTRLEGGRAKLWRVSDGSLQATLEGHAAWIHAAAFSVDGTQLATGSEDRTARLWRVDDGGAERTFEGHTDQVLAVAISPDGQRFLTGSRDKTARLWRVSDGGLLRQFQYGATAVTAVAFSPDGQSIAVGSEDGVVRVYDTSIPTSD
ncbi:MAG: WD40 repeat domain-containing protein [Verrucomicrobiales bacterium]|nr:WD40 repeat domain-containing protein [Verrucomicrobiales bacterium]